MLYNKKIEVEDKEAVGGGGIGFQGEFFSDWLALVCLWEMMSDFVHFFVHFLFVHFFPFSLIYIYLNLQVLFILLFVLSPILLQGMGRE